MCVCVCKRETDRQTDRDVNISTRSYHKHKQLSDGRWSLERDRRSQKHNNQVAVVTNVIHVHILSLRE